MFIICNVHILKMLLRTFLVQYSILSTFIIVFCLMFISTNKYITFMNMFAMILDVNAVILMDAMPRKPKRAHSVIGVLFGILYLIGFQIGMYYNLWGFTKVNFDISPELSYNLNTILSNMITSLITIFCKNLYTCIRYPNYMIMITNKVQIV